MKYFYIAIFCIVSFISKSQNIDTIYIHNKINKDSEIYVQVDCKYNHFNFISLVNSKKLVGTSKIVSVEFYINGHIVKCYNTKIKRNCVFGFYLNEPFKYAVIEIHNRKWIIINQDF